MTKKEKNKASREYQNGDKKKAKSYNSLSANTSQPQTQGSIKNKRHRSFQGDYPAIRVNAIKVAKKDKNKDKTQDLSHMKYYICKQKGHYANKCLKIIKN